DAALRNSLFNPTTHVSRTRVSAGADGKLAVEVLVDGKARAVKDEDGMAFLAETIKRGETYAVRIINGTDQEMAAELTLDGLNMFQFSEVRHTDGPSKGQPRYSTIILGPGKQAVIRGWHRTNERSSEFKVTGYAETAAASVGLSARSAKLG